MTVAAVAGRSDISTIQGMDVVAVRALATVFGGAGDRFLQVSAEVTNGLGTSWWRGRDADDFRTSWSRQRTTLHDAAAALREMRATLLRQADQQAAASQAFGPAAGPPIAARSGPVDGSAATADLHGAWDGLRDDVEHLAAEARAGVDDVADRLGELGGDVARGLEWLAGPEGPSIEDATARVPGLQRTTGDLIDAAMRQAPLAGLVTAAFGFTYVPGQDLYTTNEHSIQSHLGFHDIYDRLHKLGGMDLDDEVVEFAASGTQYRLELWKGGYGSGGAFGGEIGLYTRRPDSTGLRGLLEQIPGYSSSAQGDDQIPMTQTIYDKRTGEVLFTNHGAGAADGDHYWNLAIRTDPGVRREDLGQMGTLHVADPQVRLALADAMRRQGLEPTVDDADGTVSYTWEG